MPKGHQPGVGDSALYNAVMKILEQYKTLCAAYTSPKGMKARSLWTALRKEQR